MSIKLALRKLGSEAMFRSGITHWIANCGQAWRIIMYHRITTPAIEDYPLQPGMYVAPQTFSEHMEYLAKHCQVLELDTLVAKILNKESISHKTVAITFDDGWLDNYTQAFPVLSKLGLPATIFLATHYIDSSKTFWSDALPFAVSKLRSNYDRTRIQNLAQVHEVPASIMSALFACLDVEQEQLSDSLDSLITECKSLSADTREGFADALLSLSGGKTGASFLNWEQVREMGRSGIQFGSHTHHHLPLNELTASAITKELELSKAQLLDNQVNLAGTFCYPEGKFSNTSQQTLEGFGIGACLAADNQTDLHTRPAMLGRIGVHQDISATTAMFASRIWGSKRG